MAAAAPAPRLPTNFSHDTGLRFVLSPLIGHAREQALAHCLSSSTLLFFRPPALSSGWGIMRSSASLPYTPRGAMCKNVCHLRWRQGSDRRAKQHNCSVGSVHVTDCSRAKHASTHMYVGMTCMYSGMYYALFRTRLGGWRPRRPPFRPRNKRMSNPIRLHYSTLGWSPSTAAISKMQVNVNAINNKLS